MKQNTTPASHKVDIANRHERESRQHMARWMSYVKNEMERLELLRNKKAPPKKHCKR